MSILKILLIGVGGFGKNHLRVWNELNVDLYVADLSTKSLEKCSTYNMKSDHLTTDYREFLDKVDAVDIVTPTDSHFKLCKECIEAGKDVFVEKPITLYSHEAEELIRISEKNGQILQVGHIFRFNPATIFIKKQIDEGKLGKLRYIFGHYMGFKRARTDVGVTHTDSIHYFDLFNYFLGKKPIAVTSETRDYLGRGLDDVSHVILDYGYELAHVESGYFPPENWRDLTIVGDKATIVANIIAQEVKIYNNYHQQNEKGVWIAVEEGITHPKIITQEPLRLELHHFLECIEKRQKPLASAEDGLNTLKIVEAAYKSSETGMKVKLE